MSKINSIQPPPPPPPPPPRGGDRYPRLRSVVFFLPICTLLFAACDFREKLEEADREIDAVADMLSEVRASEDDSSFGSVRVIERHPYIGAARVAVDQAAGLPDFVLGKGAIVLPQAGMISDAALAGQIEEVTGLAVHFAGQVQARQEGTAPGADALAIWRERVGPAGVLWSGSLDALLDGWTEAAGYQWRFDAEIGRIEVVRHRSVLFHVHALAGTQSYSAESSASDGGGTEGGSASSSHSLNSSAEFDPWGEIGEQLRGLVAESTEVTVSQSSGGVLVSGVPGDVARVRAYLAHLNQEVLRPVTVSIHVYAVRMNRGARYDLGLGFEIGRLLGEMVGIVSDGTTGQVQVVRPSSVEQDTLTATVEAMSQSGRVSRVLSADVPSLNHKPAQFFELFKQTYVKELRTTQVEGGGAQTQVTPGTVSSGFAFSFVPQITGPGEVLLKLFASLQDVPEIKTFGPGDFRIQLPEYGTRAVNLVQKLRRGETLVVTGFRQRDASTRGSGTFDEDLVLPAGGGISSWTEIEQVLLVRAEIGPPLGVSEVHGAEL